MKNLNYLAALLISSSLFTSCKEEVSECDVEGLVCTEVFTTKQITVKTAGGDVVPLDSIVVKKSGSSTTLFTETPTPNTDGTYKLISDSEKDDIVKEGTDVTFYGYFNNNEVVNENFKVGHDCCHVVYISGTQDVVIQ